MKKFVMCVFGLMVFIAGAYGWAADGNPAAGQDQQIRDAVKQYIEAKAATSGTVDVFDSQDNKVRNLILMEQSDKVDPNGSNFMAHGLFRDKNTGDVVAVDFPVQSKDGAWKVVGTQLHKVDKPAVAQADPNKVFTDKEVQDYMTDYVTRQSQITGSLTIFDEKVNKLRKLTLIGLDPQVRRFGVLYISSADFKDYDNKEKVLVDISVENKSGNLGVQAMRIRKVSKLPKE